MAAAQPRQGQLLQAVCPEASSILRAGSGFHGAGQPAGIVPCAALSWRGAGQDLVLAE